MSATGSRVGGLVGYAEDTHIHATMAHGGVVNGSTSAGGLGGGMRGAQLSLSRRPAIRLKEPDKYVGGLVGFGVDTEIMNSTATSNVSGMSDETGGLVGTLVRGMINTSSASGDILAKKDRVGGLVGAMWDARILHSTATGEIRGANDDVGGLVGLAVDSEVRASAVNRSLIRAQNNVGGLVGHARHTIIAQSNTAHIDLRGNSGLGGLVGSAYRATIKEVLVNNTVVVEGDGDDIGGILGYGELSSITAATAQGQVTGKKNSIGGLVGFTYQGIITASRAAGAVTGNSSVGGLIGGGEFTTIVGSAATGTVTGEGDNIGGLVGLAQWTNITTSYHETGEVRGDTSIGGLVGAAQWTNILASYATGHEVKVQGSGPAGGLVGYALDTRIVASYADTKLIIRISPHTIFNGLGGGLVGWAQSAAILSSYASGTVSIKGISTFGRLVGSGRDMQIRTSYARGRPPADSGSRDGFVGYADGSRNISATASYWDSDIHSNPTSISPPVRLGEPKTTVELGSANNSIYATWKDATCPNNPTRSVWDFGTDAQYPVITCTPGGVAVQQRDTRYAEFPTYFVLGAREEPEETHNIGETTLIYFGLLATGNLSILGSLGWR